MLSGSPVRNSVSPRSVAINAIRKRAEEDSSSSASAASSSSVKSTILPLDVATEQLMPYIIDDELFQDAILEKEDFKKLTAGIMKSCVNRQEYLTCSLTGFNTSKPAILKAKKTAMVGKYSPFIIYKAKASNTAQGHKRGKDIEGVRKNGREKTKQS